MDTLTCAILKHIVLNNINKSNLSKHCENSNDLKTSTAAFIAPSTPILTQIRDCKVVCEDIFLSCGAAKLQSPEAQVLAPQLTVKFSFSVFFFLFCFYFYFLGIVVFFVGVLVFYLFIYLFLVCL